MGLKYANFYISYNFFKILNPFPKHFYNSGQRLAWLYWNDISCHRVYTVWYWIELFKSIIHESVQSVIALFYNTHNTWNSYCVVTPCLKSDYSCCNKVALNPLILCTHESQTWIQKFLKEINGAFSVTLLCKSNWFFFLPLSVSLTYTWRYYMTLTPKMAFTWYYIHTRPIVGVVRRYWRMLLWFQFRLCWTREQKIGTFMFIMEQPELVFQLSSSVIYHW